eukprot:187415_1
MIMTQILLIKQHIFSNRLFNIICLSDYFIKKLGKMDQDDPQTTLNMNSSSLQYIEDFNNYTFEICKMFRRFRGNDHLVLVQSVADKHKTFESEKEMAANQLRKNRKKYIFVSAVLIILILVIIIGAILVNPVILIISIFALLISSPCCCYFGYNFCKNRRKLASKVESIWSDVWKDAVHFDCEQRNILEFRYNAHYGSDPYPSIHEPQIQKKDVKTICKFEDLKEIISEKNITHNSDRSDDKIYYLSIKHAHGAEKYRMGDSELLTKTTDKIKQILNRTNLNTVQIKKIETGFRI